MLETFICLGCRKEKKANHRLWESMPSAKGKQKYCSDLPCQKDKKRLWYKKK